MGVPTKIVGAWRRSGLLLDTGDGFKRCVDFADVIWLQTPEWFVDIRLLIDPSVPVQTEGMPDWFSAEFSFAGRADWNDPVITWNHAIDMSLEPAVDANPLTWVDGVAFETGKTEVDGVACAFIEEWLRMTDDDVTWKADVADDEKSARIEIGNYCVEIKDERGSGGGFSSTRYSMVNGEWVFFGEVTA